MLKSFNEAVEERRSIYGLGKEQVVPIERVLELTRHSLKFAPSAFNSQSSRVVVLFGEHHDKLWDITRECLRKVTPPENFPKTLEKLDSISSGYGTALFFEDEYVVEDLQQKYPLYKENFPIWSQQASGMLQFIIWAAFEAEGLGMSLQHYNPLIDPQVKKQWALPDGWKLVAEMPFGKPLSSALKKDFLPVEDRIMVFR